jgi:hypothetical protein
VNFVETYMRGGVYPVALPSSLGTEAAGVVEEIGPGARDVKVDVRVAYAGGPLDAYAQERVMPADRLVSRPDGISDQQAAAMIAQRPAGAISDPPNSPGGRRRDHPFSCGSALPPAASGVDADAIVDLGDARRQPGGSLGLLALGP